MFLAQLCHESGYLTKTVETDPESLKISKAEYGKYIGRGYIQLSGIYNYRAAGKALYPNSPDKYVDSPTLVEDDPHAWHVTSWYWKTEVCNMTVTLY